MEAIIFGCSPFINEIAGYIPKLQEKYYTIGINNFPVFYPNVNSWFFYDNSMVGCIENHYRGQKIHTRERLRGHLERFKITNFETFRPVYNRLYTEKKENYLLFKHFTISTALNWCLVNGFKDVYLAGIEMDSEQWQHFYCDNIHFTKMDLQDETFKYIYQMQEYMNIWQLNKNCKRNLQKKDIKQL